MCRARSFNVLAVHHEHLRLLCEPSLPMRVLHRMFHFGRFNINPPPESVTAIPGAAVPDPKERRGKDADDVVRSLLWIADTMLGHFSIL